MFLYFDHMNTVKKLGVDISNALPFVFPYDYTFIMSVLV